MQDRYAGDIGDFVKLGLLRALGGDGPVGVAWWRHPDEIHNGDGRHIGYLTRPQKWRDLDPSLFDALGALVASGKRSVAALEAAELLPDATYCTELIPTDGPPHARAIARRQWFARTLSRLDGCDLIFLDPDNGLETARFSPAARRAAKCVSVAELAEFARPARTLVVYHHQTRRPGGHDVELGYWGHRLARAGFDRVDALRARPFSARAFFLLNASDAVRERASALAKTWAGVLTWHPDLGQARTAVADQAA